MVMPVPTSNERRSAQRYSCSAMARVRTSSFDFSCRVVDISATGAKIAIAPTLIASFRADHWDLVVDDIGHIPAKKVWQRGSEFGLVFVSTLSKQTTLEKTLDELAKKGKIRPLDG